MLVECAGLAAHGHDALLGTSPDSALVEHGRERGVALHTGFRFSRGFRPLDTYHDMRELNQLLARRPFDVVHLHTPRDTWPAAFALGPRRAQPGTRGAQRGTADRLRPLLIRTKHHSLPTCANAVHRWLYGSRLDHLVLAAEGLRETIAELTDCAALTPERIHVIHSSIDVHRFDPARADGAKIRREFGLDGKFVVGLVGRVSVEKGHALLLDAVEQLQAGKPELACLVVGEGDQLDTLKARVDGGPLRDRVIFTGPRRDIPDITAALDLQVVPSLWLEASPATVKEAMAMGIPVIASDVGGVREIIAHEEDGLLIPPNDGPALLAALHRLIADEPLRRRLAAASRGKIVRQFSDDHLVEASIALYRKLLGSAP